MPSGHGSKFPRKAEAALAALLTEPTLLAAAQKAGVNECTLRAWLRDDAGFRESFRRARSDLLTQTVGRLQHAGLQAVAVLEKEMGGPDAGVRVRAAQALLQHMLKAAEVADLSERVAEIEKMLEGLERGPEAPPS